MTPCSLPGSYVHGVSQARILEWVANSFSRGSSRLRDWTQVSCIGRWILYHWATREALLAKYTSPNTISRCYMTSVCLSGFPGWRSRPSLPCRVNAPKDEDTVLSSWGAPWFSNLPHGTSSVSRGGKERGVWQMEFSVPHVNCNQLSLGSLFYRSDVLASFHLGNFYKSV